MKLWQVLVTLPASLEGVVNDRLARRMAGSNCMLRAMYQDDPLAEDELCQAIENADGYIVALERVTSGVFAAAKRLQVISKFGIGTDNIDLSAAAASGVVVTNCPGSNGDSVAELSVGLMILLLRDIQQQCNTLRAGRWITGMGTELSGKQVGILGFGYIGRKVAALLRPFRTTIRAYDINGDPDVAKTYGVELSPLETVLAESDIVAVHLPLTPDTRHMLGPRELALVKRGSYLINLARGGIVDEDALLEAVRAGRINRAAVDVFEAEPPMRSRLMTDPRIIVLPHTGGVTREAAARMADMATENVLAVLQGRAAAYEVPYQQAGTEGATGHE